MIFLLIIPVIFWRAVARRKDAPNWSTFLCGWGAGQVAFILTKDTFVALGAMLFAGVVWRIALGSGVQNNIVRTRLTQQRVDADAAYAEVMGATEKNSRTPSGTRCHRCSRDTAFCDC